MTVTVYEDFGRLLVNDCGEYSESVDVRVSPAEVLLEVHLYGWCSTVMTPTQAREVAEMLQRAALRAEELGAAK